MKVTGALVLVEPTSGSILPVKLGSGVLDSVKDLKNRLTGIERAAMEMCNFFVMLQFLDVI